MRHAIVNNDSKLVVNVVVWDGAEWLPPRDHLVVRSDNCDIGDKYDEEKKLFIKKDGRELP